MTDLQVSPICFGTSQLGGDSGNVDERDAEAAIRHALELGVNIFDSLSAADLQLSDADLADIDAIMDGAVAVGGPSPETV
jgi:predicted aldo/keto reductase-like oxidoreductase